MKNKFRIIAGIICILLIAIPTVGCGNGGTQDTETTTDAVSVTDEVPTEAESLIDEAAAKEIVFTSLSIKETAAENLTVKLEDNKYIIAFEWSGFEYQYTVDAVSGEIVEKLFDGEVL